VGYAVKRAITGEDAQISQHQLLLNLLISMRSQSILRQLNVKGQHQVCHCLLLNLQELGDMGGASGVVWVQEEEEGEEVQEEEGLPANLLKGLNQVSLHNQLKDQKPNFFS
jgi:hypothetical protein